MSDNKHGKSGQYVYSMNRVSKVVPPKREILKDISLSFFPGAKIGVLGRNGAGKSSLLRIMAGEDKDFDGNARLTDGFTCGYLPQEPRLDPEKNVGENVEEAVLPRRSLLERYNQLTAKCAEPLEEDAMQKVYDEMARVQDQIEASNAAITLSCVSLEECHPSCPASGDNPECADPLDGVCD